MYAKGLHGSTAAPKGSCSGMCYILSGMCWSWTNTPCLVVGLCFLYSCICQVFQHWPIERAGNQLVAIQFRLGKALETLKFHFAKAIYCTLIWKLCLNVYKSVIASIYILGNLWSVAWGRTNHHEGVERKTKHNFPWQLLTGTCLNSLQLLRSAFLIYNF